jgi:tripartite-type tricarboxylate transporter receptor subunit TctC
MVTMQRRFLLMAVAGCVPPVHHGAAQSARPVRIVVPFGPGGFSDVLGRYLADALAPSLGTALVVENRPGAGGNVAAELVARAEPDGTTLLLAGQAITSINPALYARLPFDPVRDFAVVGFIGAAPNILLGGPGTPGGTLARLIATARETPEAVAYGSVGVGSVTHLAAAMLEAAAGVRMTHVPYRGAGPAQTDLRAGRIAMLFENAGSALAAVRGGGVTALGVSSTTRMPELPDVPAIAEFFAGFEADGWYALLAPASTPALALARLRQAVASVVASSAYQTFLQERGARPMAVGDADAFLAADRARWGDAVRRSGARAE